MFTVPYYYMTFLPPSPSWQVRLLINSGVSAVAALYSYWGWVREEDCKLLNRSHYHLQQKPAMLPVEQSKASSCSLVPCPLCSASALKKCANFGVCPWKGCCCYKELECADFDLSPQNIMHFLVFFWVMITLFGVSACLLTLCLCESQTSSEAEKQMIVMDLSPGNSLQNCLYITGGRELQSV